MGRHAPPGWQPTYEKVRYIWKSTEHSIFLRDPVVVGDQWFCGTLIKGPLLKGMRVKRHGSTDDLLDFLIKTDAVLERTPMRLDPYSKQLQELVELP